jgi:hypothetical protein
MLTRFQICCQLGTGPTETEHYPQYRFGLLHAPNGTAVGQPWRRTHLGKQIEELTAIDGPIREHFIADVSERVSTDCRSHSLVIGGDDFPNAFATWSWICRSFCSRHAATCHTG